MVFNRCIALLLVLCSYTAWTQPDSLDSLIEEADQMVGQDYFKAEKMGSRALQLAGIKKDTFGVARSNQILGINYWVHAQYDKAKPFLLNARSTYLVLQDRQGEAQVNNTIGLLHFYLGDYDSAIYHLNLALDWYLLDQDSSQIARVSNNLGLVYDNLGEFVKSTELIIQGIKYKVLYTSLRDQISSSYQQNAIHQNEYVIHKLFEEKKIALEEALKSEDQLKVGNAYSELGKVHQLYEKFDSARFFFGRAMDIFLELDFPSKVGLELRDIARTYYSQKKYSDARRNILASVPYLSDSYTFATLEDGFIELSNIEFELDDFTKSREFLMQALLLADSLGHRSSVVFYHKRIGETYLRERKYAQAEHYLMKGLKLADELGSFRHRNDVYEQLYLLHKEVGNYRKSLFYQEKWIEMVQVMDRAMAKRSSLEFQAKYENEVKESEINELNQKQETVAKLLNLQRYALILVGTLVIIVIFVLIFLSTRLKRITVLKKKLSDQNQLLQKQNEENELLVKEVHHRVKNNLQMISSLLSMQNRRLPEGTDKEIVNLTQNRVRSIGLIHEHLYLNEELSRIYMRSYITDLVNMICQSHGGAENMRLQLDIDDVLLDMESAIAIGLIVNELVINSLKYAFRDIRNAILTISLIYKGDHLQLEVSDNGPGMNGSPEGFGWTIINSLAEGIEAQITTENCNGFCVHMTVPGVKKTT